MTTLRISTDRAELDVERIRRYLAEESYWARGLSRAVLDRALANSLCFGGYAGADQVAFGRVVTDYATLGFLKDVFVFPAFQGRGYGKALVQAIVNHPDLREVKFMLGTEDAHGLYERFGFEVDAHPERVMSRAGTFLADGSNR